ncbi:RnfH family protein [Candidatus Pantoea edessiphila]|uniref:UPF0125 protein CRV12_01480 n=1 Tax=Candidatus Pantoea edessiphila TaxID=2044610 RepID=A0A2P5T143_9GAMM|nr:RnfH family protein [Candidatus Pantoea edessiphila]PPI88280.1 RnfH family protein [Candidatus Pantoea edessiphila]
MYVELVYAVAQKYYHFYFEFNNHSTVKELIEISGILELHNEINLNDNKIGIYGKLIDLEHIVKEGDRIEIYRSLPLNPIELRRQLIKKHVKNRK